MEAKAEARYIRTSPQKARLVIDLIRGVSANEARIVLRSTNKRLAPTILKVLDSAIAKCSNKSSDVDVTSWSWPKRMSTKARAWSACAPPPWAALIATSAAWRISWLRLATRITPPWFRRSNSGTESTSIRISAGVTKTWRSRWFAKQDYAKLLREDLELKDSLGASEGRRCQLDRSGSPRQQAARYHPHFASRNHHRQARRGNRKAEAGTGQEDQARSLHRHSGSSQAWARCATCSRVYRPAAWKARSLSPRDAQSGRFALRFGCKGIKVRVSGRLNGAEIARSECICKVSCRCTLSAPILITDSPKRTPPTVLSALSAGRQGNYPSRRPPGHVT